MFNLGLAEPLWLLLLLLIGIGALLSGRATFFLPKAVYGVRGGKAKTPLRFFLPRFFFALSVGAMVVALADPARVSSFSKEELTVNRIIVSVDNSSSMYNFSFGGPIYCTDKDVKHQYPRIYVGCRALHRIIDDTEQFAAKKDGAKEVDVIGLIRFALYSKVQAYPTSDYVQLREKVDEMNWRIPDHLGVFTEIHLALWDSFLMALRRNQEKKPGHIVFGNKDIDILVDALRPEGRAIPFTVPRGIKDKLDALREELRDTFFIMITDAHPGQLESRFDTSPVSFKKLSELAAYLELPIFMISTEEGNALFKGLMRKTGFGEKNGPYRGDFLTVSRGSATGLGPVDELVSTILKNRFGRTVRISVEHRESYASPLAVLSLLFLLLGLVSRKTISRSLTEV